MKLRNKLLLSCAALAACATTMVSTTFAWYTANTNVDATGATGHSEAVGSDTLLISDTGKASDWGINVDLSTAVNDKVLKPLAYGSDGNGADDKFYQLDLSTGQNSSSATKEGYIEFSVYLKNISAAEAKPVYLKSLVVKNETDKGPDALPAKDVLTKAGLPSDVTSTYKVDILRAMNVQILTETKDVTEVTGSEDKTFTNPAVLWTISTDNMSQGHDTKDIATYGDAHKYYKTVTGKTLGGDTNPETLVADPLETLAATTDPGTVGSQVGTITNKQIMKVTVRVFINGWDKLCFDAIQGQNISLSIGFSTESANGVSIA